MGHSILQDLCDLVGVKRSTAVASLAKVKVDYSSLVSQATGRKLGRAHIVALSALHMYLGGIMEHYIV